MAGLYVGMGRRGPVTAGEGRAVLVLGPPRSGKTTSLVVPNVLAAPGSVVTTSTKGDVMAATAQRRGRLGTCWLFDPTGSVDCPTGVRRLTWSPVAAAAAWDDALLVTRALAGAARPAGASGEAAHWTERAEAMLAPLLHAAALCGGGMADVVDWVLRQDTAEARAVLVSRQARVASAVLGGLAATDQRELSGIWSTAAGVLAAYRSDAALAAADGTATDPASLAGGADTVFVCAPGDRQELAAPVVAAFLERVRAGAYGLAASDPAASPTTLVLDEVANIAPLPGLPALVSEGGGQGVVTLACLQDLSQARHRWGARADGFPSLFGTKVVLPGIGDSATLELVSRLAGEVDVSVRTTTRGPWWARDWGAPTSSVGTRRQRSLPFDAVSHLAPGTGLVLTGPQPPSLVSLPPWWGLRPPPPSPSLGL